MKTKIIAIAAAGALAVGVAGCSPPAPQADMPATTETAAATGPIRGAGVVKAVDASTGSITLDHEPIEAIKWGAMTMEFKATDPAILQGVVVGDHVAFELKSKTDPQTVTMVQKQ